jgi:hypothetical protein
MGSVVQGRFQAPLDVPPSDVGHRRHRHPDGRRHLLVPFPLMGHQQDPSSVQDPTRVTPLSEHGPEGPLFFRA